MSTFGINFDRMQDEFPGMAARQEERLVKIQRVHSLAIHQVVIDTNVKLAPMSEYSKSQLNDLRAMTSSGSSTPARSGFEILGGGEKGVAARFGGLQGQTRPVPQVSSCPGVWS
eukprot:5493392-Pyramimonas_sp.AAC.1